LTKVAVLIANGKVSKTDYVKKIIDSNDFFISIDAKLENLKELGVRPNLILGDLDSAEIDGLDNQIEVIELSDQNKTDLEKSLDYCKEHSIKKVLILGSSGLRDDHSMANILLASSYSDNLHIELITSFYRIIFVKENTLINAPNAPVSIISLSTDNKITTRGLKYNLNNEKLKSFSHGISNEVKGENFTVEAESTIVVFIGIY
jgi:thiamine pyrophosphokinase